MEDKEWKDERWKMGMKGEGLRDAVGSWQKGIRRGMEVSGVSKNYKGVILYMYVYIKEWNGVFQIYNKKIQLDKIIFDNSFQLTFNFFY